jgi:hypothetical protein
MSVPRNRVYPAGGSSTLAKQSPGTPITTNATSPVRGFGSGAQPTGPQVQATGGGSQFPPGHSGLAGPAPICPKTGKPLSVAAPRLGGQSGDGLRLNGVDATGKGLAPGAMSPSDEIANRNAKY